MAGLTESPNWEAEIYQIETTDPVVGGPPNLAQGQGIANAAQQQLANRTAWLKAQIEALGLGKVDVSELDARIAALLNGAPAAMDTLKELSDAITGNDDELAALIGQIANKMDASEADGFLQLKGLANEATSVDALTDPGIYRLNQTQPGVPAGLEYGTLVVLYAAYGGVAVQLLFPNQNGKSIYWRSGKPPPLATGDWEPWSEIWHSSMPGLGAAVLGLLDGQRIASGGAWIENGEFVWEDGVNRINHNDGGGNVQIRFGHKYDNGDVFTHNDTAFYIGGDLDDNNGSLKMRVASNGGAGTGQPVVWGPTFEISATDLTFDGISLLYPLGPGQTWQDKSGDRVTGTSYQNTTGRQIFVVIAAHTNSSVQISSDGSSWISLNDIGVDQGESGVGFVVPHGHYYRLNSGGIRNWSELR